MLKKSDFILPDWPAPANVHALQTTRHGGISELAYTSFNLGSHVQDNPLHVAHNRQLLSQYVPSEPVWLNQVHGVQVINAANTDCVPNADASFTTRRNVVCVTMTADCLPILLCDTSGTVVAAVHAGWRSLCDGVIEATVAQMLASKAVNTADLMAWLGPSISPQLFEVGSEVRTQFIANDAQSETAFKVAGHQKWLMDIYTIAAQRLNNVGVNQIFGGGYQEAFCTISDKERFFSFRRDNVTGRMASLIWLTAAKPV